MPATAKADLERGAAILKPLLEPCGFAFKVELAGNSSGGAFAVGRFTSGSRSIELHHRQGLGFVIYHFDAWYLDHEEYLNAVGAVEQSRFLWLPKGSGDERYRTLRFELEQFFSEFLTGSAEVFLQAAKEAAKVRSEIPSNVITETTSDIRKRQIARDAFREKRYKDVMFAIASLAMPESLTTSEKIIVKICRRKLGWDKG